MRIAQSIRIACACLVLTFGSWLLGSMAPAAHAATLEVGPSGYPYISIQAAIGDAVTGDVVLVHDGTYVETITWHDKAITVRSENGPEHTIIDCHPLYWEGVVQLYDLDSGSVLEGFTITGGLRCGAGSGIGIRDASPVIRNCIIMDNWAFGASGILIGGESSSPTIIDCVISQNHSGEISGMEFPVTISDYRYRGCGVVCENGSSPILINCLIAENESAEGSGLYVSSYENENAHPVLINCTITGNKAFRSDEGDYGYGGGIALDAGTATIVNSIICGNYAEAGSPEIYLAPAVAPPALTYSDICQAGFGGGGNINEDPLFGSPPSSCYYLATGSPCVDAGNNAVPGLAGITTDLRGNSRIIDGDSDGTETVDMGAYEYFPCGEPPVLTLLGYRTVSWNPPLWGVEVQILNNAPNEPPFPHANDINAVMNEDIPWLTIPDPSCNYVGLCPGQDSWGERDGYTFDLTNHPGGSFSVWFDVTFTDDCGIPRRVRLDPEFEPGTTGDGPNAISVTRLGQNYPNPFNPSTTINFQIATAGPAYLGIYDVSGKLVRAVVDRHLNAGSYAVNWDGKDASGVSVASGIYFYKMKAGSFTETKKMVLMR